MALVYSTRFAVVVNGAAANYTVPADKVAILRCITAFNRSTTARAPVYVVIGPAEVFTWYRALDVWDAAAGYAATVVDLRVVMNPGDTLQLSADGPADMTASGYLLPLP